MCPNTDAIYWPCGGKQNQERRARERRERERRRLHQKGFCSGTKGQMLKRPKVQPRRLDLSRRIRHLDAQGEAVGDGEGQTPADTASKVGRAGTCDCDCTEEDTAAARPWGYNPARKKAVDRDHAEDTHRRGGGRGGIVFHLLRRVHVVAVRWRGVLLRITVAADRSAIKAASGCSKIMLFTGRCACGSRARGSDRFGGTNW